MIEIYLKANSEDELIEALPMFYNEGWLDNYGKSSLHVIGTIYSDGEYDENGEVITPPVAYDGFHANLVNRDNIEVLESLIIPKPNNPRYEWA